MDGARKRIGISCVHRYSYIDLNRCGTPLIEIVTEPDIRSSEEACACDMEKGHLRCDANVSVRLLGAEKFGVKAEVKNLNSFRFLKLALDYEIQRQTAVLEAGGRIIQETRLYDPEAGETAGMRSKEEAHDYRYFPEPDLAPLRISDEWRERLLAEMQEPPASKRARFVESLGLREYDAEVLTATRPLSEYFEQVAATSQDPRAAANWVMGELIVLIAKGEVSGKMAKEIFAGMFAGSEPARAVMERQGFKQISDTAALEAIVAEVLAANPKQVEQYKSGKGAVLGFLVGQVMKATRGQANPAVVNEILQRRLR